MACAIETDSKMEESTFKWRIENISQCWWLKEGGDISSDIYDGTRRTQWKLFMDDDKGRLSFYLQRLGIYIPEIITVFYKFAILGKDGSILKTGNSLKSELKRGDFSDYSDCFLECERTSTSEKKLFFPEDAINVQCTIWVKYEKPTETLRYFPIFMRHREPKTKNLICSSVIEKTQRWFRWRINEMGIWPRNEFKDELIAFNVTFQNASNVLNSNITSVDNSIKCIAYKILVLDSDNRRINCGIEKYLDCDLDKKPLISMMDLPEEVIRNRQPTFYINKFLSISKDPLSLVFEFVIGIVKHSNFIRKFPRLKNQVVVKEKPKNLEAAVTDLKNDRIFSDIELRTSTKAFPAHRSILSARSPVFRKMFSNDMEESNSEHVDITDFDEETVQLMLHYLYTDSLEGLQFESALKLHEIACKYEIRCLKYKCSSLMRKNKRREGKKKRNK